MKKRLVNSLSMVKGRSLRGGHRPDHRVALRATPCCTVVTTLRAPLSFGIARSHKSLPYTKTSTLVDGLRGRRITGKKNSTVRNLRLFFLTTKMTKRIRGNRWCFTLNNYSAEEITWIDSAECKYIIYGKEVGKSGTPHLQGYLELEKPKELSSVKKMIGNRAHLELARGTSKQASDYCRKEGVVTEREARCRQDKATEQISTS